MSEQPTAEARPAGSGGKKILGVPRTTFYILVAGAVVVGLAFYWWKNYQSAQQASTASTASGTDTGNVDTSGQLLTAGDVLLLCSDGLHRSVTPGNMAAAVDPKHELNAAAAHLVSLANARDGSDNVTVQIIRIKSVESVGMYRGRLYKLPKARYE